MERLEKSDQFSFDEIISVFSNRKFRSNHVDISSKILLKLPSALEGVKFWMWMIPNFHKLDLNDSQPLAIKLEPILIDSIDQKVYIFDIPNLEPEAPRKLIKKNSRKPGPNLRPH